VWLEACLGPDQELMVAGDCGALLELYSDAKEDVDASFPKFAAGLGGRLEVPATSSLYLLVDLVRELRRCGATGFTGRLEDRVMLSERPRSELRFERGCVC
jgi:hypothetical protein